MIVQVNSKVLNEVGDTALTVPAGQQSISDITLKLSQFDLTIPFSEGPEIELARLPCISEEGHKQVVGRWKCVLKMSSRSISMNIFSLHKHKC